MGHKYHRLCAHASVPKTTNIAPFGLYSGIGLSQGCIGLGNYHHRAQGYRPAAAAAPKPARGVAPAHRQPWYGGRCGPPPHQGVHQRPRRADGVRGGPPGALPRASDAGLDAVRLLVYVGDGHGRKKGYFYSKMQIPICIHTYNRGDKSVQNNSSVTILYSFN